MTPPSPETSRRPGFSRFALLAALVVGLFGLYPHLRWSLETGAPAWFFNSYDEGYYGWLAVSDVALHRALSDLVMHGFYFLSGAHTQSAMMLADLFLPLAVTLAGCYLVRPLSRSAAGMVARALFVIVSAECLALRSRCLPYDSLYSFLQEKIVPLTGGSAGILQIDNQTSTFWLFRTPEPQVSWIIMFLTLGLALRLVLRPPESRPPRSLLAAGALAGFGYLFCTLGMGGAFLLFGVLALRFHRRLAVGVGAAGLVSVAVCLGVSVYAARQSGAESLVFPSHRPVVMLSGLIGLAAAAGSLVRCWRRRDFPPVQLFAIALGLTPLCVANQQLLTGRMIYLLNFENFGLPQLAALACLLAALPPPAAGDTGPAPGRRWPRILGAMTVVLGLGGILGRSQWLSYQQYRETNRLAKSYALTLQAIPADGALVVCDDFFETDTLALLLGYRPPYLINRDMIFTHPVSRLKNAQTAPADSAGPRRALFSYLALTGVTPEELDRRFGAITEPDNPSWQDRFLLGGFLYNHADFWAPFTHGRDTRLPWIVAQKASIMEAYRQFLATAGPLRQPVIFVMQQDKPAPDFLGQHHARPLTGAPGALPVAMKAYRIEAATP